MSTSPSEPNNERRSAAGAPAIDVRRLAEMVYQLLLADLRLERARGAQPARRKER